MINSHGGSDDGCEQTLLLVEDEALIALSEAQMLSKHGFQVMTAHSGPRAIETAKNNTIDLILMDIDLGHGKMDGTEAARIILSEADIPVVFLSSHTEPEVVEKTDKITAYGYVVKNTGETVLTNAIKMAFKLFEAKSELQRNEQTLEVALDNSHAGIAIADAPEGRLRYVNDAGLMIRGGDREAIVNGVGIDRYVSSWRIKDLGGRPLLPDEVPLARAIRQGEKNSREFIVEREDHEDRIVMANAAPIFSKAGAVDSAIVIFLDVTEFKQVEKQLYRTNALLERTEGIAHIGGWEWEIATDTVVWSKELYRITGLDPRDPPPPFNADHHRIYTEESWKQLTECVENTLKTGQEYEILAQMVRPDGEQREVAIYGGAHFGPDGTIIGLYGIVQDITSRRKMERAYWSQEEDLRITLDSIGDAVISTDNRGAVLRMNPVAEEYTGWALSDAQGKMLPEIFRIENAETGAKVEDPVEQVLSTGKTVGLANHTKLISKDGQEYHIADSAAPIRDAEGRTRGVVLVFHDVTEGYGLRQSLRMEKDYIEQIAETSPVSIVRVDKDGHIVYANRQAEAALGLSRDAISDRTYNGVEWDIKDLIGEPFPTEELPFQKILATGEAVYDIRHSIVWPDGERKLLSVNAAPLYTVDGEFDGIVASITDITERYRNEQHLKRALVEKDLLMKEINHRVKNNLAMITSLLELKNAALGHSANLSSIIRQISSIHLIHEKLYQTGEISDVDARECFSDLLRSIFGSFSAGPVQLELNLATVRIGVKRAIPLGLIINEIATNAIQHGFDSERPNTFTAELREDTDRLILKLSNTGAPFPDEIGLENPESFGLQLISVLVEQLDGSIDLQRRPDPVFTISIPLEE